nr:hypothetical protein [Tanacetum cinerariifolium]
MHYHLMLIEVILNGDSPVPTRVIEGVVQPVAPTTVKHRLARKNELKAYGTLLMALPDKHQLKFNIHKDAKTLMEAIEKRFGRNKETKKVKSSSSASTSTQNIDFISSENTDGTNEPVSVVTSVFAASAKNSVSALPNVDTLSNVIIYSFFASQSNSPQLDNDDLKQIDDMKESWSKWNVLAEPQRRNVPVETSTSNALVLPCDGVGSYDWSFQAKEKLTNYALMAFTSSSSSSSDNENFSRLLASQTNDETGLGYNNQVFTSFMFDCDEMFSSETDENLPASPIYDRYQSGEGYHAVPLPYTGTFMPHKPDLVFHDAPNVNETVHTTFNVELSPTKPDKDLSHTHRPLAPIIEDWVSNSEDDYEAELPQNASNFVQPTEQVKSPRPSVKPVENSIPAANHKTAIPKPKTYRNSRNRKACFVCKSLTHLIKDCDYYEKQMVQKPVRSHAPRGNHQHYTRMTLPNPQRHAVPIAILSKSKLIPFTAARTVTIAVPQPNVTRPRLAKTVASKVNAVKGVQGNWEIQVNYGLGPKETLTFLFLVRGNPQHALKDKGVIDSGCSRHMTESMSYLSDFEEINGGYVAFGGNPKGGKITGKGKIRTDTECIVLSLEFKLPDDNQVLLRVPRENNIYNVDLKNIVPSRDLTCLFTKATLDESNLWHKRLGHINFKTINKLVKGYGSFDSCRSLTLILI